MLMQLKLAGKVADVRGIIFGEMVDCVQSKDQPYTLEDVVMRVLREVRVPVAYGVRSGHVSSGNITLPIGIRAAMKVTSEGLTLKMLESATAPSSSRAESVKTL
jgi:muramoyltetrapeptide carboxypeptidase